MSSQPRTQEPPAGKENPSAQARALPPLGFVSWLIAIYWALYFVVGLLDKPYFYGFVYGMASALVFALCFLGWWWSRKGLSLGEKTLGFLLIFGGAVAAGKFAHSTMNILVLCSIGIPLVATCAMAWIFLVKQAILPSSRVGLAAVAILAWAPFLVLRNDGFDARLRSHVHWRWAPTSEELFLAQKPAVAGAAGVAKPAAAVAAADPHEWTAFRGPDRDGVLHGTHITTDWKNSPPPQVWKHAVGPAWSSLIVVGDYLYTQEQRGPKEAVVCYDSATGRELWSHEDTTRFDEAVSGPGPRATPTFAAGHILALGGTGILNCLDAQTGKLQWTRDVKNDAQSKTPMWGFSSSPLVVDQNVIVYGGGEIGKSLLAYRLDSGAPVWTAALGEQSYSSPQLTTIAGTSQILMFDDVGVSAVDPASGKILWQSGKPMKGSPRPGQPHLVGDAELAVAVLDGPGVSLVKISKEGGQWNVAPVWASKDLKPEFPDFVVRDGKAYGFDVSIFSCLDLATGKRAWKEGRFGRGQVILLADQGLLLVLSEGGEAILLAADPQGEKELGRFPALNGKTWNHPVIANGRLYLRNAEEMACYAVEPAGQAAAH